MTARTSGNYLKSTKSPYIIVIQNHRTSSPYYAEKPALMPAFLCNMKFIFFIKWVGKTRVHLTVVCGALPPTRGSAFGIT